MDAKKVKSCSRDASNCFPDEVLAKILSFLPTKQAASTSLLSRRWRNLFTLMIQLFASEHHFYLDDSDLVYPEEGKRERKDVQESFKDFVDKTLSGSKSIKKLSLKCPQIYYDNPHTDQWVSLATERGVVDLDLGFKMISTSRKTWFCPSAFSIKTLVKLTIGIEDGRKIWNSATGEMFLPVLKSLFLQMPWCRCETLCLILLPGCPILEELSLNYLPLASIYARPSFSISHKTLKRLTVHYGNSIDFIRLMLFDTPSLVYLDFSGSAPGSSSRANFSDSLVEAKLDVFVDSVVGPEQWKRDYEACVNLCTIMNWMRNAKTLSLSSVSVKHMYSRCARLPFFSSLIKLQFESSTKEGWEVLRRLLNKSPKLETLVLKGLHCVSSQGVCISHNEVKVLEIYGFRGGDSEMRQVKCFLRGMQFLQVMKVEIDADDNNKLRLINHLLALPMRSSNFIQFL